MAMLCTYASVRHMKRILKALAELFAYVSASVTKGKRHGGSEGRLTRDYELSRVCLATDRSVILRLLWVIQLHPELSAPMSLHFQ